MFASRFEIEEEDSREVHRHPHRKKPQDRREVNDGPSSSAEWDVEVSGAPSEKIQFIYKGKNFQFSLSVAVCGCLLCFSFTFISCISAVVSHMVWVPSIATLNEHEVQHRRHVKLWDDALAKSPWLNAQLCKVHDIRQAAARSGDAQSREYCQKLAAKMEQKEFIAGHALRCAASLSATVSETLTCRLTPFSKSNFFFYWTQVRSPGVIIVEGDISKTSNKKSSLQVRRAREAAKTHMDTGFPIIATGGDNAMDGFTEAFSMVEDLVAHGVPPEAIGYEPQALCTSEHFFYSFHTIRRFLPNVKTVILVTSDFHMPRAAFLFQLVLRHFQRKDLTHLTTYFQNKKIKLDEHAVKSDCTHGKDKDIYDGAASNSFKNRVEFEQKILEEGLSEGNKIWGQNVELVQELADEAKKKIQHLRLQVEQCTGPPA